MQPAGVHGAAPLLRTQLYAPTTWVRVACNFPEFNSTATAVRAAGNEAEESASFRPKPQLHLSTQRRRFTENERLNSLRPKRLGSLPSIVESGWRTLQPAAKIRPLFHRDVCVSAVPDRTMINQ